MRPLIHLPSVFTPCSLNGGGRGVINHALGRCREETIVRLWGSHKQTDDRSRNHWQINIYIYVYLYVYMYKY